MHKQSKVNCIILNIRVNDLGLAFVGKVGIFWTLVQVRTMCGSRTGGWSLPGVMSD
jgi:hypothetical protein